MTRWMREQRSPRTLLKKLWRDFPENMDKLIQLPGLLFDLLNKDNDECE